MAKRPELTLIQGDRQQSARWLDFPQTIVAKSPHDPYKACVFRVSRVDAMKAAGKARRNPAFAFWSMVLGLPPPVNAVRPELNLSRLDQAVACFEGIKRPIAEDEVGRHMVAYILNPRIFYAFDVRKSLACVAAAHEVPGDLVFVVHAKLDVPCDMSSGGIVGAVTHWGFVENDPANPSLPIDWNSRYDRRLW